MLLARTVGAIRADHRRARPRPRGFSLLAFGGAGPLIAPLLAREMEIREVIVPADPSGFSAWGMLGADVVEDAARTLMALLDDLDGPQLDAVFAELEDVATDSVRRQGVAPEDVAVERRLELRYLGQEHALPVVVGSVIELAELRKAFEELHVARYGHAMDNRLQVLNVRVRAIGRAARPFLPESPPGRRRSVTGADRLAAGVRLRHPIDGRFRRVRASAASRPATCSTGRC